jgi:hypothetical protein
MSRCQHRACADFAGACRPMQKIKLRLLGLAMAIAALNSSDAICSSLDKTWQAEIVGAWSPAPDPGDPVEGLAEQFHLFGLETFRSDGSGTSVVFKGQVCGQIVSQTAFKWRIVSGELISVETDGPESHDKIMQLDRHDMLLKSLGDGITHRRIRQADCARNLKSI